MQTVPSELPEGWRRVALGDVCEIKRGTTITRKEVIEGSVPVIAGGQQPAYFHNQANCLGPVITVSGSGAYAGFVNFFDAPIFASDCSTIQAASKEADIEFIYLFLKSIQDTIYELQQGSGQPHVYPKDIAKIEVPLPPLQEQKRIAAVLTEQMTAVEQARKASEACLEAVRALPAAYLREAFSGGGWQWVALGDVCTVKKGRTPKAEWYGADGVRIIRYRDVSSAGIDWIPGYRSYVTPGQSGELQELLPQTTLLTADAHNPELIGKKVCYVDTIPVEQPVYYSGELIAIQPMDSSQIDPVWPCYWLMSHEGYERVQSLVSGVHLNSGPAKKIPIPLPPIREQKRLAAFITERLTMVEKVYNTATEEASAIAALPASLLRQAFSGAI